jgi:hypothetical protein
MPNLFDTFSLGRHFAGDRTTASLLRVAKAISTGQGAFDRVLLNDESVREKAQTHKSGIDFSREQLSALVSKAQTLQGRLQTIYQSMMDRYMVTNSDLVGTDPAEPDSWNPNWRSVGRAAMLAAKGAHAEESQTDAWARRSNNLGRLFYQRPGSDSIVYQERGGYYTSVNYLQAWDLHQIVHSYATGTTPSTPAASLADDEILEIDSVDLNRFRHIDWKSGTVIPLDPGNVFTPEFLAAGVGNGDVIYDNAAATGYSVGNLPVGTLYAYVTEVESLPDGASRPMGFTLLTSADPTDYDGDGVPDSAVKMKDYLLGVSSQTFDLKLDYPSWDFTTMRTPSGWYKGFGTAASNASTSNYEDIDLGGPSGPDMHHWWGVRNPVENSAIPGQIWDGTESYDSRQPHNGWWWSDNHGTEVRTTSTRTYNPHAYFKNDITFLVNPLRHGSLSYSNFATIDNDDDGNFYFSRNTAAGAGAVSTSGTNYASQWEQLMLDDGVGAMSGANLGLSATNYRALSSTWLEENKLFQTKSMGFYFHGTSGVLSGVTDPAGVKIAGGLTIRTITGQDSAYRYYIDEYGDIYDRFGPGNSSPDDYDYVPDVATNEKENYVGNIFGARRSARRKPLDTNGNGSLDASEQAGRDPELPHRRRRPDRPGQPGHQQRRQRGTAARAYVQPVLCRGLPGLHRAGPHHRGHGHGGPRRRRPVAEPGADPALPDGLVIGDPQQPDQRQCRDRPGLPGHARRLDGAHPRRSRESRRRGGHPVGTGSGRQLHGHAQCRHHPRSSAGLYDRQPDGCQRPHRQRGPARRQHDEPADGGTQCRAAGQRVPAGAEVRPPGRSDAQCRCDRRLRRPACGQAHRQLEQAAGTPGAVSERLCRHL